MLDQVISVTPDDCYSIIHSDRGCHYRWPGWIERMNNAGFIRSTSKKGCSPDNSACEGFFGRLKMSSSIVEIGMISQSKNSLKN